VPSGSTPIRMVPASITQSVLVMFAPLLLWWH